MESEIIEFEYNWVNLNSFNQSIIDKVYIKNGKGDFDKVEYKIGENGEWGDAKKAIRTGDIQICKALVTCLDKIR